MVCSIEECKINMLEKNVNTSLVPEQQRAFDFTLTETGQRAIGSKHSAKGIGHFAFPQKLAGH